MSKTPRTTRSWLAMFSFIAILLLGLALAVSFTIGKIFPTINNIAGHIRQIAIAIALIVPLFYSYYEARRQKKGWFIAWIIAAVLVVVFYILSILGI